MRKIAFSAGERSKQVCLLFSSRSTRNGFVQQSNEENARGSPFASTESGRCLSDLFCAAHSVEWVAFLLSKCEKKTFHLHLVDDAKQPLEQSLNASKDQQHTAAHANQRESLQLELSASFESNSSRGQMTPSTNVVKRSVSFANEVDIIEMSDAGDDSVQVDRQSAVSPTQTSESPPSTDRTPSPPRRTNSRLPPASDTLVEQMDSNLRMLIIKELSKNARIPRPPSRMSELKTRDLSSLLLFARRFD